VYQAEKATNLKSPIEPVNACKGPFWFEVVTNAPVDGLKAVGFAARKAFVNELLGANALLGYMSTAVFPDASDEMANSPLPVINAVY